MKKRQRGGISSMQDALGEFLRVSGLTRHLQNFPVFEAWNEAVGRELAQRARPVRFERGELVIEVESAAHLHELVSFTGEGYRLLANQRLAAPAGSSETIHRLSFKLKR